MKILLTVAFATILSFSFLKTTSAQTEENRNKVQLTVNYGGKTIVTDLNSVSTSLTRNYDDLPSVSTLKDSVKNKLSAYYPGSFYLTVDAKKISDELLKVFAKKQNRFNGTITIVDTYGKNPARTIKFTQASLYSYSDQLSSASYSDAYGASAISFFCKEISINGITIEQ
ncbi:type VI secretion system tube protein TssD [Mucilaginibacter terrae]|uniref:type VI secretion system tube protein TssD n=1 Tax=Mucilaginibacter terrae TaxID=1955052 RepID=UPI003638C08C